MYALVLSDLNWRRLDSALPVSRADGNNSKSNESGVSNCPICVCSLMTLTLLTLRVDISAGLYDSCSIWSWRCRHEKPLTTSASFCPAHRVCVRGSFCSLQNRLIRSGTSRISRRIMPGTATSRSSGSGCGDGMGGHEFRGLLL